MSKSKTTTNQTQTMTPTNPEWVTQGVQGFADQISGLAGQDPQQFVAGPSALQQQGFDLFSAMGGQGAGWMNQAAQGAQNAVTGGVGDTAQATASAGSDYMGNYFNPFTQQVVGSAISDMDRARQLTQNANGQGAIMAGGYGGSRQGVLDANADSEFIRNVGSVSGGLNAQGFNTAANLGQADASRFTQNNQFNAGQQNQMAIADAQSKLQGSTLLGQLGQYGTSGLMDAGATQQAIAQNQAGAPVNLLSQLSQAYSGLPLSLFSGSNTQTNGTSTSRGSLLDTVGKVIQIGGNAAAMFSDARLKEDVEFVGSDAQGRRWYEYRYAWDGPETRHRGVMAQEVIATDPDAVGIHPSGFLMVDYSKLEG